MGGFFAELRRRHIYRVGAGYVVVAWGIAQVIDFLSQVWALPDSVAQPITIILAIGFPITLIAAWLIEGKAHETVASAVRSPATMIDYALFGALALVLAGIGYQQSTKTDAVAVSGPEETEEASDRLPNSIAVLPFENLSPDPDNAYFAAGIHETLLNELAKISDMNVISRTSVLRYADGQTPIPEIARELHVETVMEGSVQYADGQVRITAQLIDPDTGAHLWSENYDRDFSGIFAIQTEIASNIAVALEAQILPAERESIATAPTQSVDAYSAFLKAMAVVREGFDASAPPVTRSIIQDYLDEALQLDPQFAVAHAWKAVVYAWSRNFDPIAAGSWNEFRNETERRVIEEADAALALDPIIGLAHGARAYLYFSDLQRQEAELEADEALRLSPNDPEVLRIFSEIAYLWDRPEDAIRELERALTLDPENAPVHWDLGYALRAVGRTAEANDTFRQCLVLNPRSAICALGVAMSELVLGNRQATADALKVTEDLLPAGATPGIWAQLAYGYSLVDQTDDAQRLVRELNEIAANRYVDAGAWAWASMSMDDYAEALNRLGEAAESPQLVTSPYPLYFIRLNFWSDPMLEQPDFVAAREKLAFR